MKRAFIILLIIPVFAFAQTTEELDFIAPIYDGVAAVKKGNTWGFINDKGVIIINFRDDLVLTKTDDGNYPIFKNDRCLIVEKKESIAYFGYIDKTGETVIEPKFLNAFNFNDNHAIVLKLITEAVGTNEVLKKRVVYHRYFEVIINLDGHIKEYLNPKGVPIIMDKKYLKNPPKITSRFISKNIVTTMNENKKWVVKPVNL